MPICSYDGYNTRGQQQCQVTRVSKNKANFCQPGEGGNCERAQQFQKLDSQANTQYVADVDYTQQQFNSIVFNAFIFLQVQNSLPLKWLSSVPTTGRLSISRSKIRSKQSLVLDLMCSARKPCLAANTSSFIVCLAALSI